eukprot:509623-Rhodomonas_salina.6
MSAAVIAQRVLRMTAAGEPRSSQATKTVSGRNGWGPGRMSCRTRKCIPVAQRPLAAPDAPSVPCLAESVRADGCTNVWDFFAVHSYVRVRSLSSVDHRCEDGPGHLHVWDPRL